MKNILKPAVILTLIAFIGAFALSHIYKVTKPYILKQDLEKQEKALSAVLPGYSINIDDKIITKIDGEDFAYWTGEKNDETGKEMLKGYAFICEKAGYSGPVRSMVGIDDKGIILGISIIQQSETPGLGARSTEIASQMTFMEFITGSRSSDDNGEIAPWFQEQFKGLDSARPIKILKRGDWNAGNKDELINKNAVSAITGASLTTKTVRDSIESGIIKLRKCLETVQAGKEAAK